MLYRVQDGAIVEEMENPDLFPEETPRIDIDPEVYPYYTNFLQFIEVTEEDELQIKSLSEFKDALKLFTADRRWRIEESGLRVQGLDVFIPTTEQSQNKIQSILRAYEDGSLAEDATVSFVVGVDAVQATKPMVQLIKGIVTRYVQDCFDRQAEIYEWIDINIGEETSLQNALTGYRQEVESDWPSQLYDQTGAPVVPTPPEEGA